MATAATAGKEAWGWGKLDTAEMTPFDAAVNAAKSAAQDLGLHFQPPKKPEKDPSREEMTFTDDKGAKTTVTVERRSSALTAIRIDVGIFGSEVTARLFLTRLRAHLPRGQPAQSQTAPASADQAEAH